ncbi:hypothetical protein FOCG_09395 [Fusarium oxysporum f. sp. radicis-lycopersici 26381]|uniref:Uncharacterized protein n=1 Tax=Fusarium oxysporum Fo47 TaxID=660027 RepID=W9KD15_FUSOX|nr:hypothetical protein FOZG_08805 [Fusarium oxysporum Fo47]EWZ88058.1 hypothetical protein FOWG_09655 [Fusarium oxysporum f. sp. lycopersici MN25]EXL51396.1 hypothetical protein FOCG_09395 [Fusarium oxysporum f. sp. radicis-lycopersici 26381]
MKDHGIINYRYKVDHCHSGRGRASYVNPELLHFLVI